MVYVAIDNLFIYWQRLHHVPYLVSVLDIIESILGFEVSRRVDSGEGGKERGGGERDRDREREREGERELATQKYIAVLPLLYLKRGSPPCL